MKKTGHFPRRVSKDIEYKITDVTAEKYTGSRPNLDVKLQRDIDCILKEFDSVLPPNGSKTKDSFTCPACGKSQVKWHDVCPDCGVIVAKFNEVQARKKEQLSELSEKGLRITYLNAILTIIALLLAIQVAISMHIIGPDAAISPAKPVIATDRAGLTPKNPGNRSSQRIESAPIRPDHPVQEEM